MPRQAVVTARAASGPDYSQAVVAGNLIFVSGTVGRDPDSGQWPPDVEGQCEQALKNLQAVLEAAGSSLGEVVKTTVWLTDPSHAKRCRDIYAKALSAPLPARSAPVVRGFPVPEALISIEAIAVRSME
jgi:2-iminobutanoate/2-iminopropanoate deaminase